MASSVHSSLGVVSKSSGGVESALLSVANRSTTPFIDSRGTKKDKYKHRTNLSRL